MNYETITLGAGCFWCVEAVLQRIHGVQAVRSGYSGGRQENATYRQVCSGSTGHAEVVQVDFDPQALPLDKLLEIFFALHDPTTLNRQGADTGTQYRSVVFYHSEPQKRTAEEVKKRLDAAGGFAGPIVTEISEFEAFYPAEDYHRNYYNLNPENGYCQAMIVPKLKKLGLR